VELYLYSPVRLLLNNVREKVKVWNLLLMQLIVASLLSRPRNLSELPTVNYSRTSLIRKLAIRIANNSDRLGSWGKFVEISTKLTCHEITGYPIMFSTLIFLVCIVASLNWSCGNCC
jgi:hypothetical protein